MKWVPLDIKEWLIAYGMAAKNKGPLYHGCTLILAWLSKYIRYKVYAENTYYFPNFNDATVEFRE